MKNFDDDIDIDDKANAKKINNKKILLIILPILIAIGISVGFFYVFYKALNDKEDANYSVVKFSDENSKDGEKTIVFYDLPEFNINIVGTNNDLEKAKLKINLELYKIEDIKTLELLLPRISDAITTHVSELTEEELRNSDRIYWLKEELIYRLNLILAPIKINNLNFKNFEITSKK